MDQADKNQDGWIKVTGWGRGRGQGRGHGYGHGRGQGQGQGQGRGRRGGYNRRPCVKPNYFLAIQIDNPVVSIKLYST